MGRTILSPYDRTRTVYDTLINNCHNPNMNHFKYYGGKAITVCVRWRNSFENFIADVGVKPAGWDLMRINKLKGYSPTNVRWVSVKDRKLHFYNCRTVVLEYRGFYLKATRWATLLRLKERYFLLAMHHRGCSFRYCVEWLDIQVRLDKVVAKLDKANHTKAHFIGARLFKYNQSYSV